MTIIDRVICICGILIFFAGFLCFTDDRASEQREYCEMVALHRQHPDQGWPDFHHNYNEVCKDARPSSN